MITLIINILFIILTIKLIKYVGALIKVEVRKQRQAKRERKAIKRLTVKN